MIVLKLIKGTTIKKDSFKNKIESIKIKSK